MSSKNVGAVPSSPPTVPRTSIALPMEDSSVSLSQSASAASTLAFRPSNASLSTIFASTSSPPTSRPISPSPGVPRTLTPKNGGRSASPRPLAAAAVTAAASPSALQEIPADDPRILIMRAFVPHVAIFVSEDTDEIARQKGFAGGFLELVRPFGETIPGKVTVRDSMGSSKTWIDFGVRFVELQGGRGDPRDAENEIREQSSQLSDGALSDALSKALAQSRGLKIGGNVPQIEELLDQHLSYSEALSGGITQDYLNFKDVGGPSPDTSPFYTLYLRKLLSGLPLSPHETFSHPTACVIAISSRNASPIETLRELYDRSSKGEERPSPWVSEDYLRYYVLVHDEDNDDVSKSVSLFEQMKRHFGLHCHLLRIRSTRCVQTDDESVQVPMCRWTSAAEELVEIQRRQVFEDVDEPRPYIFESDYSAVKAFVRELVAQSLVPFMERCVTTWNDQVASRRRGFSGRFMSLSKKWTGFGSSRSSGTSTTNGSNSGSNSNYDSVQGSYKPETPEATMRRLADFAFMLRDWKLAQSIYDIIRSDFNQDKAWKYHAGANEMAALSCLLTGQALNNRPRSEAIDQLLESASYSYLTRCASPYYALRSILLGSELLRIRGGSSAADAARWTTRILELRLVAQEGQALVMERVAACYGTPRAMMSRSHVGRLRKAAFWNVLATEAWLNSRRFYQAQKSLNSALEDYDNLAAVEQAPSFNAMKDFIGYLQQSTRNNLQTESGKDKGTEPQDSSPPVEEESEQLDYQNHRKSLIGATAPLNSTLDTTILTTNPSNQDIHTERDDDFEEETQMG